ncbi:MAG: hypothetical protein KDE53_32565 [Caldilineaceae bacterium]|nr:hypothetical protein [Caldilineaceae bacterium]
MNTKMLNKVPEVTLFFWLIKIMATTVGETAADFLNFNLHLGLTMTSYLMTGILVVALAMQLRERKYVPSIYWFAVVLISIVGTLVTDNLVDNLGVSLEATTIGFSLALAATFLLWYLSERTLSIHTIYTTKRELFYWLVILFTFALGTAAGDLVAESFNIAYWPSALIFGSLIGAITLAHYGFKLNAVFAFWSAYILTRPFGASMGDFLSQPTQYGGLNLGTIGTSAVFLVAILGLVTYLSYREKRLAPVVEVVN